MIEIKLKNIKCPICNKHSFLKIIYDETNKLYSFKCDGIDVISNVFI